MLRSLITAIENTKVVDDDREADLWLRSALAAYGAGEDVIDVLRHLLSTGRAVLCVNPKTGAMILWIRTGEESEGWFSVEPIGLRRLG